jgi:nitroreductase
MKDINKQVIEALNFRHACKEFDENKKISEADFETILESARLSPSSFGFEPWQFLVVQNPDAREKLRKSTWGANGERYGTRGQLGTSSHFVLLLSKKAKDLKYDSKYLKHLFEEVKKLPKEMADAYIEVIKGFQSSNPDLDHDAGLESWACKQTYIAMGNMMHSAAFLGIDSCPIEGFEKDKIDEILKESFDVDTEEYQIASMIAFGYRKNEEVYPKSRRMTKDVIRWI